MLLRGVGCQGGALAPFSFFGRVVVHGGGTRPWVVRERSAEGGQPEDRWCFWTGLGVPGSLPRSIVGRIVLSSVALVSRARHAPPQVPDFPERAMPAMVGWVRLLVVGGGRGRWSVGTIPLGAAHVVPLRMSCCAVAGCEAVGV